MPKSASHPASNKSSPKPTPHPHTGILRLLFILICIIALTAIILTMYTGYAKWIAVPDVDHFAPAKNSSRHSNISLGANSTSRCQLGVTCRGVVKDKLTKIVKNSLPIAVPLGLLIYSSLDSSSGSYIAGRGDYFRANAGPTVNVPLTNNEKQFYEGLSSTDPMAPFVAQFIRTSPDGASLELENLLHGFKSPMVIQELTMGIRNFAEDALNKWSSLYYDEVSTDPSIKLTAKETALQMLSNERYQQLSPVYRSLSTSGYFLVRQTECGSGCLRTPIKAIANRLKQLKAALEASPYFAGHQFINSRLLVVYDQKRVGVWMIDFEDTVPVPSGRKVTHKRKWVAGNYEDGYLIGLKAVIRQFMMA